jgi:hypothetical protein
VTDNRLSVLSCVMWNGEMLTVHRLAENNTVEWVIVEKQPLCLSVCECVFVHECVFLCAVSVCVFYVCERVRECMCLCVCVCECVCERV